MVKVKSDREEIIARAKADVEARKRHKESLLKKLDGKSLKKPAETALVTESKKTS